MTPSMYVTMLAPEMCMIGGALRFVTRHVKTRPSILDSTRMGPSAVAATAAQLLTSSVTRIVLSGVAGMSESILEADKQLHVCIGSRATILS